MNSEMMRSPYPSVASFVFCLLYEFWTLPPESEPFICNDPKISKHFKGDTISFTEVLAYVIIGPLITLVLLECFKKKFEGKITENWKKVYLDYLLGLLYTATLTEVGKASIVELRPHFLDTCRPNVNCSAGLVTEYECTGSAHIWILRDLYKSFPSGHASLSIYSASFFVLHFRNVDASVFYHKVIPLLVQGIYCVLAIFCSISRITDHRHHWWDVLSGALLGTLCAYLTILLLVHKYNKEDKNTKKN